jgi:hypothetical protein
MKKLFLSLAMAFALLFAVNTESKAQVSLGINTGYSWLSGVVGGELDAGHWGVGVGWMPTSMPGSGESLTSISWFVTYSDAIFKESSGYYVTVGQALKGYREEYSYNGGSYGDGITAAMWIGMVGYKYNWYSGLNLKGGVGYGWCEYAGSVAWECTLGYQFGLN